MEIKGILKAVQPIVERTNFKSREIWVTTEADSKYPQTLKIELNQDKVSLFDGIAVGTEVNMHCNLRGNEWTKEGVTKVFNSIVCWKVDGVKSSAPVQQQSSAPNNATATALAAPVDDLPF